MLARFYSSSGDAQAVARCVVPARVLPAAVHTPLKRVEPARGMPSIWQNANTHALDGIVADINIGNRVMLDVDDPYFDVDEFGAYSEQQAVAHRECLQIADGVIVTNDALAAAYEGKHDNIVVIPTCVDVADWQFGRQLNHLDGKLRIGYAAGGSHQPDAPLVAGALARLSEHPDVIIEFIGSFDPGWDFKFKHYPALPYPAYKSLVSTWAIALAPLVESDLNRTRSDLKVLDYGISCAAPIVTPFGPYEHLVADGVVLGASGEDEWYEALRDLVEHDDLRSEVALTAFNYCRVERHPANQRTAYLDALGLRRSYSRV